MKKFIEALKNKEVDLEHISLPFTPMSKSVSTNPLIKIGVTGVRHLQRAGGLAVWPVFYISQVQVRRTKSTTSKDASSSLIFFFVLSPFAVQRQQQNLPYQDD